MTHPAENEAPRTTFTMDTFTLLKIQEEAWNRGYAEGAIAANGLDALDNPYRVIPPEGGESRG